jgi:hypothetical protein
MENFETDVKILNARTVGWMSVHKKHENTEACPLTALKQ